MGYPGYHQQNYQQPPMGYARPQAGPGLAVTAGIVGLATGGVLLTQTIMLLSQLRDGLQLPLGWMIMNIAHFAITGIALLGAILVFVRQLTGAFVLLFAAVLTVAVIALDWAYAHTLFITMLGSPLDAQLDNDFNSYFGAMFEFGNEQAVLRFTALVLGVVLLIIAALPPSLAWLRGSDRDVHHPYAQSW